MHCIFLYSSFDVCLKCIYALSLPMLIIILLKETYTFSFYHYPGVAQGLGNLGIGPNKKMAPNKNMNK